MVLSTDKMTTSDFSMKVPPKFLKEEDYETWIRDVEVWRELTDLPKTKQALAVHLSLSGRARIPSSEIPLADLKKETGFETLMTKLDALLLQDEGSRQFRIFRDFYNLRRDSDLSIKHQ